ncbi:flagellar basal body-associated FliL family protein, partial [bacterium]|nr:flagellar basal body-associated FliL family protein [bacterium]
NGGLQSAQISIVVECADEETYAEVQEREDHLRDAFLDTISGFDAKTAGSLAGRLKIREALIEVAKSKLEHKAIRQIYYQDFKIEG